MALRGRTLLVVLIALAVALPVVAVRWGRARNTARAGAVRIGIIVTAQLAAIAVAAVAVNDYAYFFGSWSELLGRQGPAFTPPRTPTKVLPVLALRRFGTTAWPQVTFNSADVQPYGRPSPRPPAVTIDGAFSLAHDARGRGVVYRMSPAASGRSTKRVYVYLPPEYFGAQRPGVMPLVELFGPAHSSPRTLVFDPPVPGSLLDVLQRRHGAPMAVALLPRPFECGSTAGARYYAHALPKEVSRQFRFTVSTIVPMAVGDGSSCVAHLLERPHGRIHVGISILTCAPVGRLIALHPRRTMLWAPPQHGRCRAGMQALRRIRAPTAVDEVVGYTASSRLGRLEARLLVLSFRWLTDDAPRGAAA